MKKIVFVICIVAMLGLVGCSKTNIYGTNKSLSSTNDRKLDTDVEMPINKNEEPLHNQKDYKNIYLPEWVRWDMDINELKDEESRKKDSELGQGDIKYYSVVPVATDYFHYFYDYVYVFQNDKLKTYYIQYDSDYDLLKNYNEIKAAVIEKYGNPIIDDTVWTDETYKNQPDKVEQAFKYGYVTMNCRWVIGETVVVLKWDYKNTMYLAYCHKSYENSL